MNDVEPVDPLVDWAEQLCSLRAQIEDGHEPGMLRLALLALIDNCPLP